MRRQRFVRLAFWLCCVCPTLSPVLAAMPGEAPDVITVQGNERTNTNYIRRMAKDCLARQQVSGPPIAPNAVLLKQCLLNSRLFSEVDVAIKDGQAIHLTVKDRWTLIPIPMVQGGSGKSRSTGLFLLESNFLGMGMVLAGGGAVSNSGMSYAAFFADPSIFFSNWLFNLSASGQKDDVLLYEDKEQSDAFKESANAFSTGLGYRFHPWTVTGLLSYQEKTFKSYEAYVPPEDESSLRGGGKIAFDTTDYKLYFSEGFAAIGNFSKELSRSGHQRPVLAFDLKLNWQQQLISNHALQIQLQLGSWQGGNQADVPRLGSARGFRGIDAKTAWAERYYAGSIDYQIPLKTWSMGTATMAPFYDRGKIFHRGGRGSAADYYAVGGGVYFFLKNIALPGLGLEYGYNDHYQGRFFNFSAGLSL